MGSPIVYDNGFEIKCINCGSENYRYEYDDGNIRIVCYSCESNNHDENNEIIGKKYILFGKINNKVIVDICEYNDAYELNGFNLHVDEINENWNYGLDKLTEALSMANEGLFSLIYYTDGDVFNIYDFKNIELDDGSSYTGVGVELNGVVILNNFKNDAHLDDWEESYYEFKKSLNFDEVVKMRNCT